MGSKPNTCLSSKVGTHHISFHKTSHRSKIWIIWIPMAALPFLHCQNLRSQSSCWHDWSPCAWSPKWKKKCLHFLHSGWERFKRTVAFSRAKGVTWGPELLPCSTMVGGQHAAEAFKPFREAQLVTAQSLHKSLIYNNVLPPRCTTAILVQSLWGKTTKSDWI